MSLSSCIRLRCVRQLRKKGAGTSYTTAFRPGACCFPGLRRGSSIVFSMAFWRFIDALAVPPDPIKKD